MVISKEMALRLKVIAILHGLSTSQIADGCRIKMHRNYISNIWNLTYEANEERKAAIIESLIGQGVPEQEARRAFELVELEEVEAAREQVKMEQADEPEPADIEINPDEKIETMGVVMLRRRVRNHFSLARDPFQPQLGDQPFKSQAFQECLDLVLDAIDMKAFLALSGPTGCGKSVLWVYLRQQLARQQGVRIAAIRRFDKKRIRERDVYFSMLQDLGDEQTSMGRSNEAAIRRVEDLLAENTRNNITTVILLNEAHDLATSGFVLLKRLWEMFDNRPEMGYSRSCAVIMLGQEGLAGMLNDSRPELREVCQRADVQNYGMLKPQEVHEYLRHRMGDDCDRIFDESAIEYFASRRLRLTPQIVNVMATRAINDAAMVGATKVTAEQASLILN